MQSKSMKRLRYDVILHNLYKIRYHAWDILMNSTKQRNTKIWGVALFGEFMKIYRESLAQYENLTNLLKCLQESFVRSRGQ